MKSILRFPGAKFSKDLLTGDETLDRYLQLLDAQLMGAQQVRSVALLEIRDHLLQRKAGLNDSSAAVKAMGAPEVYSQAHNRKLAQSFLVASITMGASFGAAMGLMGMPSVSRGWPILMLEGIFFGVSMSWCFVLAGLGQATPSFEGDLQHYVVSYRRSVELALILFTLFFVTSSAFELIDATLGLNLLTMPPRQGLLLVVIALPTIMMLMRSPIRYYVDPEGFTVRFLVGKQRILWSDVIDLKRLDEVDSWRPRFLSNAIAHPGVIEFRKKNGKIGRLKFYPPQNQSKFLARVREELSTRERKA